MASKCCESETEKCAATTTSQVTVFNEKIFWLEWMRRLASVDMLAASGVGVALNGAELC